MGMNRTGVTIENNTHVTGAWPAAALTIAAAAGLVDEPMTHYYQALKTDEAPQVTMKGLQTANVGTVSNKPDVRTNPLKEIKLLQPDPVYVRMNPLKELQPLQKLHHSCYLPLNYLNTSARSYLDGVSCNTTTCYTTTCFHQL
jgi:hypothetical protein